jgi:ABC-type glycerol-3-phosphate transport system substrate-binding protein
MVRQLTRRHLIGTGAGLTAGLAFGPGRHISRAAAQGTQLEGSLVIAISADPPEEAQQALTAAYNEQQPGVELTWEIQEWEPADYTAYLGTQLAAGDTSLDIVSGNYLASFRGYANLDQYRGTTNPYTGNRWDQDLNFDFLREVNALGERIMVATQSVHINWFYNKDLFAQAGVEPPTTWAQFAEVCAALQGAGITPIAGNFDYQIPQWFAEVYFDQYHTHWV